MSKFVVFLEQGYKTGTQIAETIAKGWTGLKTSLNAWGERMAESNRKHEERVAERKDFNQSVSNLMERYVDDTVASQKKRRFLSFGRAPLAQILGNKTYLSDFVAPLNSVNPETSFSLHTRKKGLAGALRAYGTVGDMTVTKEGDVYTFAFQQVTDGFFPQRTAAFSFTHKFENGDLSNLSKDQYASFRTKLDTAFKKSIKTQNLKARGTFHQLPKFC